MISKKSLFSSLIILIASTYSIETYSNEINEINEINETEYKNMEQMMGSIRLEKKQVEAMINKMIISGRLTSEDGVKAKREIASVKEEDMKDFKSNGNR